MSREPRLYAPADWPDVEVLVEGDPAVRESHALDQLGMTPSRFWQYVGALIERADVEAEYPAEVRRLRRLREARASVRRHRNPGYSVP